MKLLRTETVTSQGRIALGLFFLRDYSLLFAVLLAVAAIWAALYAAAFGLDQLLPVPACYTGCGASGTEPCCVSAPSLIMRGAVFLVVIAVASVIANSRVTSHRLLFSVMLTGVLCASVLLFLIGEKLGIPLACAGALAVFFVMFIGYRLSYRVARGSPPLKTASRTPPNRERES